MWRQNSRGLAKHGILAALVVTTAGTAAFISRSNLIPNDGKIVELRDVYVVRDVGRYGYWLETAGTGKFFTTFCADYEPQFSEGMTLKVLKYEDRGMCWSVAKTHPAYLILRDENGQPVRR